MTEPPALQLLRRWRPFGNAASIRDYAVTFAAEFSMLFAMLLVLRLAASYWGPKGFGEYVLARRTLALVQLPIMCNMGVAVSRYVAMSAVGGARSSTNAYLLAAVVVAMGAAAGTVGVLFVAATPAAALMFGDAGYGPLVQAFALALPGQVLHGVAYGYFRGRLQMVAANLLQLVNLGLMPLAVFMVPGQTVRDTLLLLAALWSLIALAAIVRPLATAIGAGWRELGGAVAELLRYGLPRVPGELALSALFSLPTTLAAHVGGVERAGFVGLGVSLLSMVGSVFAPLGQVVLPSVTTMAARGDRATLRRDVRRLWLACVAGSLVLVVGLAASARMLITWYVGPQFLPAVPLVRLVLLAGVPFVTYVLLRNVLDALDTRPLNARNLVIALALFLLLALVLANPAAVAVALLVAVSLLGLLTLRDARRLLTLRPR